MVEEICWPNGFNCDAQLSCPLKRILVETPWWISPLTATRWVSLSWAGVVNKHFLLKTWVLQGNDAPFIIKHIETNLTETEQAQLEKE